MVGSWLLVGIVTAAIGDLFGVESPTSPSADGGVNVQLQPAPGPFILWEPRERTWHDIVANSLVVRASAYPPGQ